MIGLADYLLEKSARSAMFGPKGVKALTNMMNADNKVAAKMQPWAQNFRLSARDSFMPEKSPLNRGVHGGGVATEQHVRGNLDGFVKKLHPSGKADSAKEVFSPVGMNKDVSKSHTPGLEGSRPFQRITINSKAEAGNQTALNIQNNRYNSAAAANKVVESGSHVNAHTSYSPDPWVAHGTKSYPERAAVGAGFREQPVQRSSYVPTDKRTSYYFKGTG